MNNQIFSPFDPQFDPIKAQNARNKGEIPSKLFIKPLFLTYLLLHLEKNYFYSEIQRTFAVLFSRETPLAYGPFK